MAGYFHGAGEIQADGLQTLYLMNPSFMESSNPSANMVLLNSSLNPLNPMSAHNPNPNHSQQLVGIPLQPPPSIHAIHKISNGGHGLHYNLWTPAPAQQGLSLSLSPQQGPHMAHRPQPQIPLAERELSSPNAVSSMQDVLMGSTYLKVAQQLLDEVVSVGGGNDHRGEEALKIVESKGSIKEDASAKRAADLTNAERQELQMKKGKLANMLDEVEQRYRQYRHQMQIVVSSFEAVVGIGSARTYTALALRTISKQFRSLRDAIYGQIRHTSRSLGEDVGPTGGAKSGGSRLRFIDHHLRQQRALQHIGMIQHSTWRPQRGLPERAVSVLRAWLFEHFLHPYPKDSDKHMLAKQTGLTRSQVSNWFINARVRLWKPMVEEMYLEESKDQEQNNGDENTSNHDGDEESKSSAHHDMIPTITEQTDTRLETKQETVDNPRTHPITKHMSALGIVEDRDAIAQHGIKRPRSDLDEMSNRELLMEFMDAKSGANYEYDDLMQGTASNHGGVFGGYSIGDIRRFDDYHGQFAPRFSGNGVSLTLGLHSENLSLSGAQQSYLSSDNIPLGRAVEMNHHPSADYFSPNNNPSDPHPPIAYESINIQNRKRFDSQILQDFVA